MAVMSLLLNLFHVCKRLLVCYQESIECGVKWKHMYRQTASAIAKAHANERAKHWKFDEASIFAQIDAFVQVGEW
jgi:dynein heavy chain